MDSTTIKLIQDTAIDAEAKRIINLGNNTSPLTFVKRDDEKLVSLEDFAPARYRFRGKLTTTVLSEFVGYTKRRSGNDQKKPSGFIDAENLSATMIFNLEENGHCDDLAILRLKKTAAYTAVENINGNRLEQRTVAEWLEDWNAYLTAIDQQDGGMNLAAAIAAIRKITISEKKESAHTADNFKGSRSAMEEIEAKNANGLPAYFQFKCAPYLGLEEQTFRLRVSVLTSHDKPMLVLRIVQKEVIDEAIAQDFKRLLLSDLESVATLTIGTFAP